ncbi:hypothetical protein L914_03252 [Phytophthora nicotianae]|uniref:BZIP domain-containing protein n=1 Tax=Phytophthora nicotianae TaxID=4792 RepID=W2NZ88_PHYNI|nr:hypothetical protein L914_03252 [Phytophthora nicotianae]
MPSSFAELRKLDRREQCRVNQARYRSRQRNRKQRLEQAVEQLHHEVDRLKSRRQQLTSREIVRQSPWCIVTNLFHVLKCSFRSPWKQANVEEMTNYIDTYLCDETFLLGQLRCYSQYFGDPRIELQQIEAAAPEVLIANATLSITVTKLALRHVFPHLLVFKGTSASKIASLRDRLIGRRLDCSVSMSFMFDGETGRVATIETYIDLMAALFRVLGSLENVSQVLDHALVG